MMGKAKGVYSPFLYSSDLAAKNTRISRRVRPGVANYACEHVVSVVSVLTSPASRRSLLYNPVWSAVFCAERGSFEKHAFYD